MKKSEMQELIKDFIHVECCGKDLIVSFSTRHHVVKKDVKTVCVECPKCHERFYGFSATYEKAFVMACNQWNYYNVDIYCECGYLTPSGAEYLQRVANVRNFGRVSKCASENVGDNHCLVCKGRI